MNDFKENVYIFRDGLLKNFKSSFSLNSPWFDVGEIKLTDISLLIYKDVGESISIVLKMEKLHPSYNMNLVEVGFLMQKCYNTAIKIT